MNIIHNKCLKHHGKTFIIFYDADEERYYFQQLENKKLRDPIEEDKIYLDWKYNQKYESEEEEVLRSPNYITRLSKFFSWLPSFLLICASSVATYQLVLTSYYLQLMEKSLEDNDHLTENEKEFILSLFDLLEENITYIDVSEVRDNLSDLDIEYNIELDDICRMYDCIAYYDPSHDYIFVSGISSFENLQNEISVQKTLAHEICHIFSLGELKLGDKLYEAMNEVISYEYGIDLDSSDMHFYLDERLCLYALLEIVDINSLKKFYFGNDIDALVMELTDIIDDPEIAVSLIQEIDSLEELRKTNLYQYKICKTNIYNQIKKYFETKYEYPMDENESMMLYLVYSGFHEQYKFYDKKIRAMNIIPKGYFSNHYKEEHPNTMYDVSIQFLDFDHTCLVELISFDFMNTCYIEEQGKLYIPKIVIQNDPSYQDMEQQKKYFITKNSYKK